MSNVTMDSGKGFFSAADGKWAGEQLLKALQSGKPIGPECLRTADTLRKDEWVAFDEALVEEATIRLRGIADLVAAGLTIPVANAMGKTIFEYEKVTDMNEANVSLDGMTHSENDRQTFDIARLPLPLIHKEFSINLRTLVASRERGEALDTTQVRTSGRLVAEQLEKLLFQGGPTFGGNAIYGYTTHPDRNESVFGTNGIWSQAAKTGENILADLMTMIQGLENDRMFGPYWLYVPRGFSTKLEQDFKANSDKSIRQRLLEVEGLRAIRVCDQMVADEAVLVQATRDVTALVEGVPLQTVQWDMAGGFNVFFKAFQIAVPLVRSDAQGRSGVFHMSGT